MTEFVVKQGEASFEARFASPAFMLLSQSNVELHPNMLLHLGKYGLTLNNIRIEVRPYFLFQNTFLGGH